MHVFCGTVVCVCRTSRSHLMRLLVMACDVKSAMSERRAKHKLHLLAEPESREAEGWGGGRVQVYQAADLGLSPVSLQPRAICEVTVHTHQAAECRMGAGALRRLPFQAVFFMGAGGVGRPTPRHLGVVNCLAAFL